MLKRRLATALCSPPRLPAAATPTPRRTPPRSWPGDIAVKGDMKVPLSFYGLQYRTNGLSVDAKIHTGTGSWIITRGTVDGHDHRSVVNAGPVAIYSRNAGAYMVRRLASSGPVVKFSSTPSYQWELYRLPGEARMRLYNTRQQDYLVQGFPGIDDVSLNWQSADGGADPHHVAAHHAHAQLPARGRHVLPGPDGEVRRRHQQRDQPQPVPRAGAAHGRRRRGLPGLVEGHHPGPARRGDAGPAEGAVPGLLARQGADHADARAARWRRSSSSWTSACRTRTPNSY